MKIPVTIAERLILLQNGERIPACKLRHRIIHEMLDNGLLKRQIKGRSKSLIFLSDRQAADSFLKNHYGIANLQHYVEALKSGDITRAEAITVSSDSKLKNTRTFKGFLVTCYNPVPVTINGQPAILNPAAGMFHFIYDFERFTIPPDVTVIGIENPENFSCIERQKHLFEKINPLFISRYPQNQHKDLLKWLKAIPNQYLHFGDFDFAGIGIYVHEYKNHLAGRASFFIPNNIEHFISEFGNRALYDKQEINFDIQSVKEKPLAELIVIIHKYKKGLEQEIFIS